MLYDFTPKVIQFFAYDFLKALYVHAAEISAAEAMLGNILLRHVFQVFCLSLALNEAFFIGAIAKALATLLTFPLQAPREQSLHDILRQSIPVDPVV